MRLYLYDEYHSYTGIKRSVGYSSVTHIDFFLGFSGCLTFLMAKIFKSLDRSFIVRASIYGFYL